MDVPILGKVALGVVLMTAGGCIGGLQSYKKAEYTVEKDANFAALRTYAWATGWPAGYQDQHERIVAAINRELAARNMTERPAGQADVTVDYGVLWRNDADLSRAGDVPDRDLPTFPVMTLTVRLREAATKREVFSARSDTPVGSYGHTTDATLTQRVAEMFEHYPESKSGTP